MPLFPKSAEHDTPFQRNDVVLATQDLPGVPVGTRGKIKVVNGFSWQRYWVFFDNGADVGSLDRDDLVRPQHWDQHFLEKELEQERALRAAENAANGAAAAETGGDASAAADPNDPLAQLRAMVPAHLLERSAAARARLGG